MQLVAQLACALHWFDPLVVDRRAPPAPGARARGRRRGARRRRPRHPLRRGSARDRRRAPRPLSPWAWPSRRSSRRASRPSCRPGPARGPLSRSRAALLAVVQRGRPPRGRLRHSPRRPTPRPPCRRRRSGRAGRGLDPRSAPPADRRRGARSHGRRVAAVRGRILVLDPATGEILANAGRARRRARRRGGAARLHHRLDAEGGHPRRRARGGRGAPRPIASTAGRASARTARRSSTTRGAYGTLTLAGDAGGLDQRGLRQGLRPPRRRPARAVAAALPLRRGARRGAACDAHRGSFEGAMIAIGGTITASPLQMAAAYAAIANGGAYVAPTLARRTAPPPARPSSEPETARTVMAMLEAAVNGERATGKDARIAGAARRRQDRHRVVGPAGRRRGPVRELRRHRPRGPAALRHPGGRRGAARGRGRAEPRPPRPSPASLPGRSRGGDVASTRCAADTRCTLARAALASAP